MTDKNHISLARKGPRSTDDFVEKGVVTTAAGSAVGNELEVTKTFRLPGSLGRRLKVHPVQTGQKEKDILISLMTTYLDESLSR